MSNDVPLLVQFDFEQGTLQFFLAPKVSHVSGYPPHSTAGRSSSLLTSCRSRTSRAGVERGPGRLHICILPFLCHVHISRCKTDLTVFASRGGPRFARGDCPLVPKSISTPGIHQRVEGCRSSPPSSRDCKRETFDNLRLRVRAPVSECKGGQCLHGARKEGRKRGTSKSCLVL